MKPENQEAGKFGTNERNHGFLVSSSNGLRRGVEFGLNHFGQINS
jgi:hypothetical protein